MSECSAAGETGQGAAVACTGRRVPLLVTAELPDDVLAWVDGLRRQHYPPDRNRLKAHVTLFHALPPSAGDEVRRLLGEFAAAAPPEARITGLMDLGEGTAFDVESPGMVEQHARLVERLHGLAQQKDVCAPRLHITVQNKVSRQDARRLQVHLAAEFRPRGFRFRGFGLYAWDGKLWNFERLFPFRGAR